MPSSPGVPGERRADSVSRRVVLPVAPCDRPTHHRRDPPPHRALPDGGATRSGREWLSYMGARDSAARGKALLLVGVTD